MQSVYLSSKLLFRHVLFKMMESFLLCLHLFFQFPSYFSCVRTYMVRELSLIFCPTIFTILLIVIRCKCSFY